MGGGLKATVSALVLCGGLVMVLASACDLSYTCDTVEPGSAGAGYPTESVGAGDYPNNEEDEEVGSAQLEMAGACSPSKTCTDMFEACQDKGYPCTREIEYKRLYVRFARGTASTSIHISIRNATSVDLSDHG
ncbi:hypothetical protein WME94_31560 [Sorangium sp. So ce429]